MKQSKGPAYEALQPKRWRYLRELGELRLAYNAKPLHLRYWSSLADGCGESNGARADANLILTMHARFPLLLDIAEKALRVQLVGDSFGRDDLCDSMSRLYGGRGHSWMPWEPPSEGPDADLDRAADAEVVVSAIDAEIAGQKRCREVLRVVNLGYIEIILYRREQEVGTCRNQSM